MDRLIGLTGQSWEVGRIILSGDKGLEMGWEIVGPGVCKLWARQELCLWIWIRGVYKYLICLVCSIK